MGKFEFFICSFLFLLTFANSRVSALTCWTCSSETEGHDEWCSNNLDPSKIPIEISNGDFAFKECNNSIPHGQNMMRPVCRKDVNQINGKIIYNRYCHFMDNREPLDKCFNETTRLNAKKIYCSDCLTDKCNDSSEILPILTFVLTPTLLAKILTI